MSGEPCSAPCIIHQKHPISCEPIGQEKDRYHCMFESIKTWIVHCVDQHPECAQSRFHAPYGSIIPTRLIDVGSPTTLRFPRLVKIQNQSQLQSTLQQGGWSGYATLSYCWGKQYDVSCLLRRGNEEQYAQALPKLPKTIEDAIKICQRLGIKYLWVDALCIFQDEQEDWQNECARVGAYYQNAVFTIAASSSYENRGGCLPYQRTIPLTQWELDKTLTEGAMQTPVSLDDTYFTAYITFDRRFKIEIQLGPLYRRGWVLQEIALSSRVLWFTTSTVFMECRHTCITKNPRTYPATLNIAKRAQWRKQSLLLYSTLDSSQWLKIAEKYSRMEVTHEEDRLVALSGICKFIDPENEDQYLAGIWKKHLFDGLSWTLKKQDQYRAAAFGPSSISKSHGGDRASNHLPSWTWLSARGEVSFMGPRCYSLDCVTKQPIVEHTYVELVSSDVHGQISAAFLQLRTPVYKVSFTELRHSCGMLLVNGEAVGPATLYLDAYIRFPSPQRKIVEAILLKHNCRLPSATFLLLEFNEDEKAYRRIGIAAVEGDAAMEGDSISGSFYLKRQIRHFLKIRYEETSTKSIILK
jgi:heterokaryon incompatibility protein (HET)